MQIDRETNPEEEQSDDLPVAEKDLERLEGRPYSGLGQPIGKIEGEPDNSTEGRPYSGK